jgi:hypothetical protein
MTCGACLRGQEIMTCGACLRVQEIMTHVYKKGFKDTKGIIRVRTSKDNKESPQYLYDLVSFK